MSKGKKVDKEEESKVTPAVEDVEVVETEEEVEVVEDTAPEGDEGQEEPEVVTLSEMSPEADQLLRLKAEYDNFRKRTAKEKVSLREDVLKQTALEFLPVYDNLDRALKVQTQDETFKKGVEMTMMQLKSILEKLELEKISALGELFDPNLHEALTHAEDKNWGENTITEVFMDGFTYRGKVVRFAQVKVVN